MPEMGGFDATRAIRAGEAQKGGHVPIVAMTAHAMKGDRERCLAVGMDEYVTKPLDPRQLCRLVESMSTGRPSAPAELTPDISDRVLARVGGDRELLVEISRLFVEDAPRHLEQIRLALENRDGDSLRRAAHGLKGAAANFDADRVVDAARTLEEMGRSREFTPHEAAWRALVSETDRLMATLRSVSHKESNRMARRRPARTSSKRAPAALPRVSKHYGWVPDLPDQRDKAFRAPLARLGPLPKNVDLRPQCPPVYDQGQLGSCTANAIAGALAFDQMKQKMTDIFPPSRLFIYYNERVMENTVDQDAGAMIRDGIKSVSKQGAPHEALWPYVISKFRTKPSAAAVTDGGKHAAVLYQRVDQDLAQMRGCLAAGYPFVFGFSVYESFEGDAVAKSGRVNMPKKAEKMIGGHAVLAVGYDHAAKRFIVRNSWGSGWAMDGYFTIPYAYLLDSNLSDDFWTVKLVA